MGVKGIRDFLFLVCRADLDRRKKPEFMNLFSGHTLFWSLKALIEWILTCMDPIFWFSWEG